MIEFTRIGHWKYSMYILIHNQHHTYDMEDTSSSFSMDILEKKRYCLAVTMAGYMTVLPNWSLHSLTSTDFYGSRIMKTCVIRLEPIVKVFTAEKPYRIMQFGTVNTANIWSSMFTCGQLKKHL